MFDALRYRRPIVIHSLEHALAAAAAAEALAVPLLLHSAAGAGSSAGVGWFAAVQAIVAERFPGLDFVIVVDCADEAGTALAALRRGLRHLRFTGPAEAASKLEELGAVLVPEAPALDLLGAKDPAAACRNWLAAGTDAG